MKTLDNKKVFVSTPETSKAVQEKVFKLWHKGISIKAMPGFTKYPFLFFSEDKSFNLSSDFKHFSEHPFEEITAAEILAMDIPEPEEIFEVFQKVLVRSLDNNKWQPAFYKRKYDQYFHITLDGSYQKQCIDYETNKHLAFTTDKP